jgi:hypothetical protein
MKIYQLHQYGGEWEDAYDDIVGSYIRKERAEEEKINAQYATNARIVQAKYCNRCPYTGSIEYNAERLRNMCIAYCDKFCEEVYYDGSIGCKNWVPYTGEIMYRIEEVEVEE